MFASSFRFTRILTTAISITFQFEEVCSTKLCPGISCENLNIKCIYMPGAVTHAFK